MDNNRLMKLEVYYSGKPGANMLTDKEKLALYRVASGMSLIEGAREAGITIDGEKSIRYRAFAKLGIRNSSEFKRELLDVEAA